MRGEKKEVQDIAHVNYLHDSTIEGIVLGALLYNNANCDEVSDVLKPHHFYVTLHQEIYKEILRVYHLGESADPVSLRKFISAQPAYENKPEHGFVFLTDLVHSSMAIANVRRLAKTLRDYYVIRAADNYCRETLLYFMKCGDTDDAVEKIDWLDQKLLQVRIADEKASLSMQDLRRSAMQKMLDARGKKTQPNKVLTGLLQFDDLVGGFAKGELVVVAARTSMGKSALAMSIAVNMARYLKAEPIGEGQGQEHVLFFSLEMSAEALMTRVISICSGIGVYHLNKGLVTGDQLRHLERVGGEIDTLPLVIEDPATRSLNEISAKIRRLKKKSNLACVFIDYLQIIAHDSHYRGNRVYEIGEITAALKGLAVSLDIPIVLLGQLSRAVEGRDDKYPQLSDLRDSGNIEQDADIVMLIHREEYYLLRKKPTDESKLPEWQARMDKVRGMADLIVAKNRCGAIDTLKISYESSTTKFGNLPN